jgi:formylglycine-generating enzyme required for sulfatase activity
MDKRPLKVFLCHAHADRDAVRALYTRLTNDGVDAWLDKEKLLGGQNWRMEIRTAVEEADVVVVCHSKEFNKEGFRQREVKWALDAAMEKPEGTIFIIPARLEECEVIKSLSDWHWVDLFEENGYEMLMRALRTRADGIGATLQIKHKEIPGLENIKQEDGRHIRKTSMSFSAKNIFPVLFALFAVVMSFYMLVVYIPKFTPALFQTPTKDVDLTSQPALPSTEVVTPAQAITLGSTPETDLPTAVGITPLPAEITDATGVSMALVSAGKFTMGYPASEAYRFCQTFQSHLIWHGYPCKEEDYLREEPLHDVSLKDYYIDVYEVSNSDYKECVDARTCVPPISSSANRHSKYWDNEFYVDYPVVYVTWEMAKTYCEWRGARLPTEAEWEKAARGVNAFTYPWGKFTPDYRVYAADFYTNRASLNLNEPEKPTTPVTSNPSGLSQYGAYNMAGNVAEWVSDWYNETYYSRSPAEDPSGPSAGDQKVVRGGSVNSFDVRTTARDYLWPAEAQPYIGIRCAKDAP